MDSRLFKLSSYDSECRPSVYRRDKWRACLETHMLLWGQAIRLSLRRRQRCTLCVLAALLLVTSSAFGWGEKGHVMINRAAAMKAGDQLPEFFRKGVDLVGYLAVQPDRWKAYAPELRAVERANHYFDMEDINPQVEKIELPKGRYEFIGKVKDLKKSVKDVGLLPYQIQEYFQRLKGGLTEYRWAMKDAAGKDYRSPSSMGSLKSIEMTCLYYAGILGHYAADASQPLHATVFYDGRGSNGKPARTGVHLRYEVFFVDKHVKPDSFLNLIKSPSTYQDVLKAAKQVLVSSNRGAEQVLKWDESGALDKADTGAIKATKQHMGRGSQFLLNLWYTAWVQSGEEMEAYRAKFQSKK